MTTELIEATQALADMCRTVGLRMLLFCVIAWSMIGIFRTWPRYRHPFSRVLQIITFIGILAGAWLIWQASSFEDHAQEKKQTRVP